MLNLQNRVGLAKKFQKDIGISTDKHMTVLCSSQLLKCQSSCPCINQPTAMLFRKVCEKKKRWKNSKNEELLL